jgi:hypothetical protein
MEPLFALDSHPSTFMIPRMFATHGMGSACWAGASIRMADISHHSGMFVDILKHAPALRVVHINYDSLLGCTSFPPPLAD